MYTRLFFVFAQRGPCLHAPQLSVTQVHVGVCWSLIGGSGALLVPRRVCYNNRLCGQGYMKLCIVSGQTGVAFRIPSVDDGDETRAKKEKAAWWWEWCRVCDGICKWVWNPQGTWIVNLLDRFFLRKHGRICNGSSEYAVAVVRGCWPCCSKGAGVSINPCTKTSLTNPRSSTQA